MEEAKESAGKLLSKIKEKLNITKFLEIVTIIKTGMPAVVSSMWKLSKLVKGMESHRDGFKLNLDQLELFYEFRYEKNRMIPILLLAVLPFGNFFAVPLAIKFPKQLLSHHFWTENQKYRFAEIDHKQRVSMYRPVLSELQDEAAFELCPSWKNVLESVNRGQVPTSNELMKCVRLFEGKDGPFSFCNISKSLQEKLVRMHVLEAFFNQKDRLHSRGTFLLFTDYQIRDTGGPSTLMFERLKAYCFKRGVNAHNMTEIEMHRWLSQWLEITKNLSDDNIMLVLFAPALLAVNHRSNSSLIVCN